MNTTYTFPTMEQKDFTKVMGVLDPANTATYTLLLNEARKENVSEEIFREKYAKLGTRPYSGKKQEGSAAAAAESTSFEYVENACEIFKKTASASATAIAVAKRNGNDIIKEELEYALLALKGDINTAVVSGKLSKTDPRAMAGLLNICKASNYTKYQGELTKAVVDNAVLKVKKAAKGKIYLAVSSADLPTVNEILLAGKTVVLADGRDVVAGVAVTRYKSIYGPVINVYTEDVLQAGQMLMFDIASVKLKVLRDFFQKEDDKAFDGEQCELIAELGISANPQAITVIAKEPEA